MRETLVQSLGQEDLLEKEMTTHSSTLVWKIPWTEEPGRLQTMGSQRVGHDWATFPSFPSGHSWWTWRSCMLQFMESQRVRHDWENELNWMIVSNCVLCNPSPLWRSAWVCLSIRDGKVRRQGSMSLHCSYFIFVLHTGVQSNLFFFFLRSGTKIVRQLLL